MAGTTTTAQTSTMNNINIVDAVVALRGSTEHTQLNSSTCQISSLEVYRGREQAIEISHQGFSLSDNGSTIKVIYTISRKKYPLKSSLSIADLPKSTGIQF